MPARVLVTGIANALGAGLARRLLEQPGIERVTGVDTREPPADLRGHVDWIDVDLRAADLPRALRVLRPDTIVHNDVWQFPGPGASLRVVHDHNVIGTLQLLTAAGIMDDLQALVVRGSAAIYGAEPNAPAFFTEDLAERFPLRTRFQRDLGELEGLVATFARRRPAVTCTVLRMQPMVGGAIDTPITRWVRAPIVPTYLGFDPRIQVLDADDAVGAMTAAVLEPVPGAVNVAADGVVSLQRVLGRLGKTSLPVLPPLMAGASGVAARLTGLPKPSADMLRFLKYGRGVDTRRCARDLGWTPARSTLDALEAAAAR